MAFIYYAASKPRSAGIIGERRSFAGQINDLSFKATRGHDIHHELQMFSEEFGFQFASSSQNTVVEASKSSATIAYEMYESLLLLLEPHNPDVADLHGNRENLIIADRHRAVDTLLAIALLAQHVQREDYTGNRRMPALFLRDPVHHASRDIANGEFKCNEGVAAWAQAMSGTPIPFVRVALSSEDLQYGDTFKREDIQHMFGAITNDFKVEPHRHDRGGLAQLLLTLTEIAPDHTRISKTAPHTFGAPLVLFQRQQQPAFG